MNLFYFLVQMLFCPCNNPVTPLLCAVVFLFPSASFCPVQIWLIAKPEISKSFVTTEILLSHSKNIPLPKAQAGSHCCRLSPTARPGTRRIQSHTASVKCLSPCDYPQFLQTWAVWLPLKWEGAAESALKLLLWQTNLRTDVCWAGSVWERSCCPWSAQLLSALRLCAGCRDPE